MQWNPVYGWKEQFNYAFGRIQTQTTSFSAVDNFLWMVYSTHHVGEICCTQKSECVPVRLSCEKFINSHNCISIVHRGIKHIPLCTMGRQSFSSNLSILV